MPSKVLVNTAHPPGSTCLAFARDGKLAYTGGSDCLVRIWRMDQGADQEPDVATDAAEGVTSVAAADDCWLSGSADSEVKRYVSGKAQLEALVTSVAAVPIRCVAVDPKGKRIAVTSDELLVKIIDLDDTTKVTVLDGHKNGVRRATWHPSGGLLTTSGSDGNIIVWDVSQDEPKKEQVIEGVIPAVGIESSDFQHDCSVIWHPSGQYFFAATRTHEIIAVSRSTWLKLWSFSDTSIVGAPTALALSPNGLYLASACLTTGKAGVAEVLIWSVQNRRLLWRHSVAPEAAVTQLAFSPTENLLAWTDTDGLFSRWPEPVPSGFPDPVKAPMSSTSAIAVPVKRKSTPTLWGEEGDGTRNVGDDGGEADIDLDNDWIIDDIGIGMDDVEGERERDRGQGDRFVKEMVSITKAQPPFQPGSTPMENKKRFLAYNMVGVIEVVDQDTHHIVNVEFHDQSTRKGYHFTDHFKYDLGYLGERGALFACPPEQGHPAQVSYRPYGTWSTQGDWTYILPQGARVLGISAGGERPSSSLRTLSSSGGDLQGLGNVVIATSANDLTFLSGTGVERVVLGLEGDFVSMVSGDDWTFVVHRPGATTIDGSQNLLGSLISFDDFEILQEKPLPIPKGHVLNWVGITDEGAPAIYDSAGHVHIMINFRRPNRGSWARVLDTNTLERKQGKDESYWPVGLSKDTLMCLILKGRQEYPGFPRPLMQELPVRMPFRNTDPNTATLEEQTAREKLHIKLSRDALGDELTNPDLDKREIELDKSLIKLIQAACKADKAPRALELAKRLHFVHSIEAAGKVAGFYRLLGLQEKIEAVRNWRMHNPDPAEMARDKRRETIQEDDPLLAPKPFQNFKPPVKVPRPGLARASGIVEQTEFTASSAAAKVARSRILDAASRSHSDSPDAKRKRTQEEVADEETSGDLEFKTKRQATGEPDPSASKQRGNPFTRKPAQESIRNPFSKKTDSSKPIQKSESFFKKVEAAEFEKSTGMLNVKNKEKEQRNLSKQTTLFGLPLGLADEKKSRNKKKPADDIGLQPSQEQVDSHVQDSTDMGTARMSDETVNARTSPLPEPSDKQVEDYPDDEPIEWPASPQAENAFVHIVE